MWRLQCLIKLKASLWGNWNFYQRHDRPGCSCHKEGPHRAKGTEVTHYWWCRALEHGHINWNLLHRASHCMLGQWPWKCWVSLVYKKKFRCKNNHKDGKFSILEWARLPWDLGDQRFSFFKIIRFQWVPIYTSSFSTIWKLVIISHRAFSTKTFWRMKLMKHGNFHFCALGNSRLRDIMDAQIGVSLLHPKWIIPVPIAN